MPSVSTRTEAWGRIAPWTNPTRGHEVPTVVVVRASAGLWFKHPLGAPAVSGYSACKLRQVINPTPHYTRPDHRSQIAASFVRADAKSGKCIQLRIVILSVAKNHHAGHCARADDSSLRSE